MTYQELPLPEFADLERVEVIKPRYRVNVHVEVEYDEDVEFQTDGDPEEYLDDEDNANDMVDRVVNWGDGPLWTPDARWGLIEVTYDNGVTWEKYEAPEPAREW